MTDHIILLLLVLINLVWAFHNWKVALGNVKIAGENCAHAKANFEIAQDLQRQARKLDAFFQALPAAGTESDTQATPGNQP